MPQKGATSEQCIFIIDSAASVDGAEAGAYITTPCFSYTTYEHSAEGQAKCNPQIDKTGRGSGVEG